MVQRDLIYMGDLGNQMSHRARGIGGEGAADWGVDR